MRRLVLALPMLAALACAQEGPGSPSDAVAMDPHPSDLAHPARMASQVVESHGAALNGIVYVAQGAGPHPTLILLHGYPGDERNLDLAQALRRVGWTVLFFHYRGAWGSPGDFSFEHALEDVAAAVALAGSAEFAEAYRADPTRIALVGHSMGGFLALTVASERPEVDCVVSLAGANLGLLGYAVRDDSGQAEEVATALARWSAPIAGATPDDLTTELAVNAERFDLRERAADLRDKPVLLVAGSRDAVSPVERHHQPLVEAFEAAGAVALSARTLDADHAFSDKRIALARMLADWLAAECAERD